MIKKVLASLERWGREWRSLERQKGRLGLYPHTFVEDRRGLLERLSPCESWHLDGFDYLREELGLDASNHAEARHAMERAGFHFGNAE